MLSPEQFASSFTGNIKDRTLENGLKVICLKKSDTPVVSVQVWYRTGSAHEIDGIRGISHFFEHMMFRGSRKYGPEEHARMINDVGGHYNAFTAEDVTAYLNSVPRDCLGLVFELESDRMTNLALSEDVLNTERNVIIEEFQTYMNNPLTKAFLEFRKEFFHAHPYTYSALGRLEDIRRITIDDCMAYYRAWYTPSNAVLAVVGDFDDCEEIFSKANDAFGSIAGGAGETDGGSSLSGATFAVPGATWMKRLVDFDVPVCVVGYPAPAAADKDAMPLEILQIVMSQGESSRLHRDVVRKQSLAVMAGGMNQCLRLAGMTLFFAVFTPNVPQRRVEDAIISHVDAVSRDGITPSEMEKVRNSVLTNRIFDLYSADHICQKLGYSETIEGDYRLWAKRLSALSLLDVDTLKASAQRYWTESARHVLYLKPKKINPILYATGIFRKLALRK
jgi:zinc protease